MKSLAAKWFVVSGSMVVFGLAGCGWWQQTRPLKHVPPATSPDVVPPVNAYGHLHKGSAFQGVDFEVPLSETATEHALRLERRVDELESINASLRRRISLLMDAVEQRDELLDSAEKELATSNSKLTKTRKELADWQKDIEQLHSRLVTYETKHRDDLDSLLKLVQSLVGQYEADSADNAGQPSSSALELVAPRERESPPLPESEQ